MCKVSSATADWDKSHTETGMFLTSVLDVIKKTGVGTWIGEGWEGCVEENFEGSAE